MADRRNWWIRDNGQNALEGVDGDDSNPPNLTAGEIAYGLRTSLIARTDFDRLYPDLLAEEQARLDEIVADNPRQTEPMMDALTFHDALQSNHNRAGVRLRMPKP